MKKNNALIKIAFNNRIIFIKIIIDGPNSPKRK